MEKFSFSSKTFLKFATLLMPTNNRIQIRTQITGIPITYHCTKTLKADAQLKKLKTNFKIDRDKY